MANPATTTTETETRVADAAQDPDSSAHVDISTPEGLERWSKALGLTGEALESAVQCVGTRVDRIKNYLTTGMAARQVDG